MKRNFIALGIVSLLQMSASLAVLPGVEPSPTKSAAKPQKVAPAAAKSRDVVARADGY
jgi:hypothetical protein